MPMNAAYRNAIRTHGASLITHVTLLNNGVPIADARKPVTWDTTDADGLMRPTANIVFNVAAGETVNEWRGYSALTLGTDYGGAALTAEAFAAAGTYTLTASLTSIDHNAA